MHEGATRELGAITGNDLGSKISFASVALPRSNGQVERASAEVLRGLKTRTFDKPQKCGRQWID